MASEKKRDFYKSTIIKAAKFLSALTEEVTEDEIATHYDRCVDAWRLFQETHLDILLVTGDQNLEFQSIEFESVESVAMDSIPRFKALLRKFNQKDEFESAHSSEADDVTNRTNGGLRVPYFKIPLFTGNYDAWPAFKDLFRSMIHSNNKMTPVQKLGYLKTNISGEALKLIKNLEITDVNYDTAWTLLTDRYDNERILVNRWIGLIFSIPPSRGSAADIKTILDSTQEALQGLKNLNRPVVYYDDFLVYLTETKLDPRSKQKWEDDIAGLNNVPPTWDQMVTFLKTRFRGLEVGADKVQPATTQQTTTSDQTGRNKSAQSSADVAAKVDLKDLCLCCKKKHRLSSCFSFQKKPFDERQTLIDDNKLCRNCLSTGHKADNCTSTYSCRVCEQRHHTLLHVTKQTGNVTSAVAADAKYTTLLATALVNTHTPDGVKVQLRALIDQGSQVSFLRNRAANRLGLRTISDGPAVKSVGNDEFIKTKGVAALNLTSTIHPFTNIQVLVTVLDRITAQLPSDFLNIDLPEDWKKLPLADPMFYQPAAIDLLLGADVVPVILEQGLLKMDNQQIIAQQSSLGWLLSGKVKLSSPVPVALSAPVYEHDESLGALREQLQRFWEIENLPAGMLMDPDDQLCEDYFMKTYHRDDKGRFVVRLPFKPSFGEKIRLGNSRNIAIYNWLSMERRMDKNPTLKLKYTAIMDKFIENGYMKPIPPSEIEVSPQTSCYLTHHMVSKGDKDRVVFNASMKTSTGFSLNDGLLVGPPLQNELFDIILRVRQYRIAFTTDVVKMFRQFNLNDLDVDYQRFVYRKTKDEDIKHYRLVTVLDGTSSASYLANKIIRTLADTERVKFPLASEIAERDIYVDDLLSGCHDLSTAIEVRRQLTLLFGSAGMQLSKWASNELAMLESLPTESIEKPIELGGVDIIKTLGLFWSPKTDAFQYSIKMDDVKGKITKRQLLSEASKLFDPMGWVAPCIIIPKILFQSLWSLTLGWDDALPKNVLEKWLEFRQELPHLEKLHIRRWTGNTISNKLTELHGFSDASIKAYAAVVYIKVVDMEGNVDVTMLASKTKVAPIRTITLPRLELSGALLLAHLLERTMKAFKIPIQFVHAHTDSQIVLAWLQSSPARWKTFVANRTAEILRILPANHWHYIASGDNPADCASRGISPSSLLTHSLWWNGPASLKSSTNAWPLTDDQHDIQLSNQFMEERNNVLVVANVLVQTPWDIRTKYSSLIKLLRVTAYCQRFIDNCRKPSIKAKGCITPLELDAARRYWIKVTQQIHFHTEIDCLQRGLPIPKSSHILTLNPMLDGYGVLRVGGRLINAQLPFERQHPIILPKTDHFTDLIIDECHKRTLHGNIQLMLNTIRDRYWILSGRSIIRQWVHKCNRCYRFAARSAQQLMGDLPSVRVTPSRTFLSSAIDYAGPIKIAMRKGRGKQTILKGYVSVFVCMATRAIHLELVGDLTADAFIAAFKRFTGRRGQVTDIYTDNGSNFVAANELIAEDLRQAMMDTELTFAELLANDGVTWHFSPPSAPHFNGLAEAGVRSMKYHLRRIVGTTILTFEELYTVLCQIEAVLNSRPIHALTNEFSDFTVLTPGHFLMGSPPLLLPEPTLVNVNENRLNRWQLMDRMKQDFWRVWSTEYLSGLQQRPKWQSAIGNLKIGQLVIIRQDDLPPAKWLLGRIEQIHPGDDGLVRVATVRTQHSTLKRPVVKLCPLPSPNLPEVEEQRPR